MQSGPSSDHVHPPADPAAAAGAANLAANLFKLRRLNLLDPQLDRLGVIGHVVGHGSILSKTTHPTPDNGSGVVGHGSILSKTTHPTPDNGSGT